MRSIATLLVLTGTVAVALADVASGPKEGEKVAALKVFVVTGEPKDKDVDYAELRQDKPTIYVFVSAKNFGRPMFRYIKTLEEKVGDDAMIVAVWLTDNA